MSLELANKVAFITGAGAGLGCGISELFFERGCSVFLTDVNGASVEALAATLNAGTPAVAGQRAVAAALDVSSESQWASAVASCTSTFGRIDILVCNAGIHILAPLEHTTVEMFNRAMSVNTLGPFLGIRTVAPVMKAQGGGSIVCTASACAVRGAEAQSVYCASKGAVRMMCKALALELIPSNIRVNMVHPGTCDTPMLDRIASNFGQKAAAFAGVSPIGRLATPNDVAEAVVFLASDRSSYMVGAELCIDGGSTCGLTSSTTALARPAQ